MKYEPSMHARAAAHELRRKKTARRAATHDHRRTIVVLNILHGTCCRKCAYIVLPSQWSNHTYRQAFCTNAVMSWIPTFVSFLQLVPRHDFNFFRWINCWHSVRLLVCASMEFIAKSRYHLSRLQLPLLPARAPHQRLINGNHLLVNLHFPNL